MSNTRAPGQKLISVPMNEKFIHAIDAALPEVGYSDRSSFIRDAIVEKLHSAGIEVASALSLAPCRTGKGGRPAKPSPAELRDSTQQPRQGKMSASAKTHKVESKRKSPPRVPPEKIPKSFGRNYKAS